jgi:hypothetical protein
VINSPDFIQIPREALIDPTLRPTDRILLGYIYWFTRLKNERCTANNATLAAMVDVGEKAIQGGLDRLEHGKYIERTFRDKNRRVRSEIICNVMFGKRVPTNGGTSPNVPSNGGTVPTNGGTQQQGYVPSYVGQNKKQKRKREGNVVENNKAAGKPSLAAMYREMKAKKDSQQPSHVEALQQPQNTGTHKDPTLSPKTRQRAAMGSKQAVSLAHYSVLPALAVTDSRTQNDSEG